MDYYRKKRGIPVEDLELYMTPIPFKDSLEVADEINCLQQSIYYLPKEDQEIINLRYFADLKFKDVATLLNKPDNSIRVKTTRITKKLKSLITKCLGEA